MLGVPPACDLRPVAATAHVSAWKGVAFEFVKLFLELDWFRSDQATKMAEVGGVSTGGTPARLANLTRGVFDLMPTTAHAEVPPPRWTRAAS